jgi:hypothetical protein
MSVIVEISYVGWLQFASEQQGDSRNKFLGFEARNQDRWHHFGGSNPTFDKDAKVHFGTKVSALRRCGHLLDFGIICRGLTIRVRKNYMSK